MDPVNTEPHFQVENSHYFVHNEGTRFAGSAPYIKAPLPPPQHTFTADGIAFLQRLFLIAVVFFLFATMASSVFWLNLTPRTPEISISAASLASFALIYGNPILFTADFNISLSVQNSNHKMSFYTDRINVVMSFSSQKCDETRDIHSPNIISRTKLPSFQLEIQNTTTLHSYISATGLPIGQDLADKIVYGRIRGHNITVDFEFKGWVKFITKHWRTRAYLMEAKCDDLAFMFNNFSSPFAYLPGTPKKCGIAV